MDSFVAFLRDNWKFLVEISIPLVSLVVLCFVKKTKINMNPSIWCSVAEYLPKWISDAESQFGSGNGKEKLKYVLKIAINYLSCRLGVDEKDCLSRFGDDLVNQIEAILEAPQKKGDQ